VPLIFAPYREESSGMKHFIRTLGLFFTLLLCYMIFPQRAYAYLDPGTGSYIFQLIIAGLLGASLAIKIFWQNIKTFFSNLFSKGQNTKDGDK
jgi:hypothetical protein